MPSDEGIPKERDRVTGESGDLGAWPDDIDQAPLEVWDGTPAVFSYMTHSFLGEHFNDGDEIAIVFRDRTLVCTVNEVVYWDKTDERLI